MASMNLWNYTCSSCVPAQCDFINDKQKAEDFDLQAEYVSAYPSDQVSAGTMGPAQAADLPRILGQQETFSESLTDKPKASMTFASPPSVAMPNVDRVQKKAAGEADDTVVKEQEALESNAHESWSVPFLEVIFDVHGQTKKVEVFKKPLGAEFSKTGKEPTTVSRVRPQSYAWGIGIEPGWTVQSIGGVDVRDKTLKEVQVLMKDGLMVLKDHC